MGRDESASTSSLLRTFPLRGLALPGFAFGLALLLLHALRQFAGAGPAIPLLESLGGDLSFDQQLGEFTALRFALDRHGSSLEEDRIQSADGCAPHLGKAQLVEDPDRREIGRASCRERV